MGRDMDGIIEVVYENGVLKPLKKLPFKEGERLTVEVKKKRRPEVIKKYIGIIKLPQKVTSREISELEDELWLSM